jgi:hypothetical protein
MYRGEEVTKMENQILIDIAALERLPVTASQEAPIDLGSCRVTCAFTCLVTAGVTLEP